MHEQEQYQRGWTDAIDALRDSLAFWAFMEGHPLGSDEAEFAVQANGACADYLEAVRLKQ